MNLGVISKFGDRYTLRVTRFSSYDSGIAMATAAYALGARVIEKHFTLNRTLKGTDHAFSLEPQGLRKMIRDLDRLHLAMGDGQKRQFASEKDPLQKMGKKMVFVRGMTSGAVLTLEDIAYKSPGDGLAPWMIDQVVGKKLMKDMKADEALDIAELH